MKLYFAPLQGYTDDIYLRLHKEIYGKPEVCYTPFIRLEKGEPRRRDINRYVNATESGVGIIPQVIFRSVAEFSSLTDSLKAVGASSIDLNMGCPYPMQTRKGRGAGILADHDTVSDVMRLIGEDNGTSYSVKLRLGLNNPNQWKDVLPILNSTKLTHVTMHPRIATQMYGGELFIDQFKEFYAASTNPVVYNGDIQSLDDMARICDEYPDLKGIMIGRGLLARPSLATEWIEGREWDENERMDKILIFHSRLLEEYEAILCGDTQILMKIKPFWDYLEPQIGHKAIKAIRKATSLAKYKSATQI
ncbi:MAG: tRNA-dihydrouridine synthase family protein [Muribaculaceae bacterium]|nr:tRNA-dihydrouridine synthase family protein [Muribaculaceae bacterium]